jgi:hypothetical protein
MRRQIVQFGNHISGLCELIVREFTIATRQARYGSRATAFDGDSEAKFHAEIARFFHDTVTIKLDQIGPPHCSEVFEPLQNRRIFHDHPLLRIDRQPVSRVGLKEKCRRREIDVKRCGIAGWR